MRRCVLDISFLSELSHSINNFSITWDLKVNILGHHRVKDTLVLISLQYKFFAHEIGKLLSDLHELFDFKLRSNMYNSGECLHHVFGSSKLGNVLKSSLDLVRHSACYIVAWNLGLIVD